MTTQVNLPVNANLEEALHRLTKYGFDSAADMMTLARAITPMKDSLEIGTRVSEAFKDVDWSNFYRNLSNSELSLRAFQQLTDIMQAAAKEVSDGQSSLVRTTSEAGEAFLDVAKDIRDPQDMLAAYIDTSLDAATSVANQLGQDASRMNAITAAYKAWLQQSLTSFTKP